MFYLLRLPTSNRPDSINRLQVYFIYQNKRDW